MKLKALHRFTLTLLSSILLIQQTECVLPSPNSNLLSETFEISQNANTRKVVKDTLTVGTKIGVVDNGVKGTVRNIPKILPTFTKLPSIQQVKSTLEEASRRIQAETVDKKTPTTDSRTPGFGPHLITDPEAVRFAEVAEVMLETATRTVSRLNVKSRIEKTKALSRIPPQFFPKRVIHRCPFRIKPRCSATSKYRTIDGSCNNLKNPLWGRALTPFERFLQPLYDNDISTPRTKSILGGSLPGARAISNKVHIGPNVFDDFLSHFVMEFGQVVSHDIQRNALSKGYLNRNLDCCRNRHQRNCFHIPIPSNDPHFTRNCMNFVRALASPSLDCKLGVRQQMNQNTHFLDGSVIYGSNSNTMSALRTTGGKLRTSSGNLLPHDPTTFCPSTKKCFKAGDVRVNQQPALMSLQTIWMREHNRIASALASLNPTWSDETLFQEARKIVGAELQHITYNEFLPKLLGNQIMARFDLNPRPAGQYYTGYNDRVKPMIRNSFSAAAFRVGHSLISHRLSVNKNVGGTSVHRDLHTVFLKPDLVYNDGVSAVTRGLYDNFAHAVDKYLTKEVTNKLFEQAAGTGQDLAAINIQRGRDHGIADYNTWRDACRLGFARNFNKLNLHSTNVRNILRSLYRNVFDIDLFTGGVSEDAVAGGVVGPTFACLIGLQFQALKQGDRFFYESNTNVAFSLPQLNEIKKTSMAKIICDNTDITSIPADVFLKTSPSNDNQACSKHAGINLSKWKEACVPVNGGWSHWTSWSTNIRGCKQTRRRTRACNNPPRNSCGKTCPGLSVETRTDSLSSSWAGWSSWSETNRKCFKIKTRKRGCNRHHSCPPCPGDSSQTVRVSTNRRGSIFDLTGDADPCGIAPIRPTPIRPPKTILPVSPIIDFPKIPRIPRIPKRLSIM